MVSSGLSIKVLFSVLMVVLLAVAVALPAVTAQSYKTVLLRVNTSSFNCRAVNALGGKVIYVAELAPVAVVVVPEHAVGVLKKLPGVIHVSEDGVVEALVLPLKGPKPGKGGGAKQPPQTTPWGIEYINATDAWALTTGSADVNSDGDSEVEVAIIDTGVDKDHPDLASNIKWGVAVWKGKVSSRYDDRDGHGTHVAGTAAAVDNDIGVVGVAHDVEVYAVKALSNAGTGYWSDLVIAIDLAIKGPDGVVDSDGDGVIVGDPEDDAPEVISLSLGGSNPPQELHDIIVSAYSYNITIVAAAGNEGAESLIYPAAYPEVIAVGAIDEGGNVPDWSNRNPELAAPGVNILSTYVGGTYETLSGTSMATPHVSATVALMQAWRLANELPPLPPGTMDDTSTSSIRGILHTTAADMGDIGYDNLYGYGVVNAYEAVQKAAAP